MNTSMVQESTTALSGTRTPWYMRLESMGAWPGYLLLFLMLFVPTAYKPLKAALLVIVLSIIIIGIFQRSRLSLSPSVLLWTLFTVCTGLGFMFLGFIHNGPGALRVGTVYVVWPLLYTILMAGSAHGYVIDGLIRVLIYSTIAIAIYSFSFVFYSAGLLPDALYFPLKQGQAIEFYKGFVEYNLYSISSLMFLMPFLVAALMVWPDSRSFPLRRCWLWISGLGGLIATILSGRKALWLIVFLSPFITLFFRAFLPLNDKRISRRLIIRGGVVFAVLLYGLYSILQFFFGLDLISLFQNFMTGFNFSGDINASLRKDQFHALLKGWYENPFFGAGHGTFTGESIRGDDQAWAYELSYMALLFQTGIFGITLYALPVVWMYFMCLRMMKSGNLLGLQILPVVVGTTCFFIANATNPYLAKFDYLWVIYLPVAMINAWTLKQSGHIPAIPSRQQDDGQD